MPRFGLAPSSNDVIEWPWISLAAHLTHLSTKL
jgi:hypothetical protein